MLAASRLTELQASSNFEDMTHAEKQKNVLGQKKNELINHHKHSLVPSSKPVMLWQNRAVVW